MILAMANGAERHSVSRRLCLKLALAGSAASRLWASLEPGSAPGGQGTCLRYYQATAVITFCGVTILSKSGVGGGYAVAEEAVREEGTAVALQFAGGSWPSKAHGVNRLGYIQESVLEPAAGGPSAAHYFGFMTSSAEKSLEQAKSSFTNQSDKPVPYSATEGTAGPGIWRFSLSHFLLPARFTFSDTPRLATEIRSRAAIDDGAAHSQFRFDNAAAPNTFLNSLRQALKSAQAATEHSLVYNGKAYRMRCTKQVETKLTRLSGVLEETASRERTPFRLWFQRDAANYLPVKIEYRAKSYLKLVFEATPEWNGPHPALLFNKETV